jgi:hypothetical protein
MIAKSLGSALSVVFSLSHASLGCRGDLWNINRIHVVNPILHIMCKIMCIYIYTQNHCIVNQKWIVETIPNWGFIEFIVDFTKLRRTTLRTTLRTTMFSQLLGQTGSCSWSQGHKKGMTISICHHPLTGQCIVEDQHTYSWRCYKNQKSGNVWRLPTLNPHDSSTLFLNWTIIGWIFDVFSPCWHKAMSSYIIIWASVKVQYLAFTLR